MVTEVHELVLFDGSNFELFRYLFRNSLHVCVSCHEQHECGDIMLTLREAKGLQDPNKCKPPL